LQVIAYFLTLSSDAHSDAWTPVLLLLFTQMERLPEDRMQRFTRLIGFYFMTKPICRFAGQVYPLLCQLWCADLRPEVGPRIRFDPIRLIRFVRCAACCEASSSGSGPCTASPA
jgi:hypothetical protein